MAHHVRQPNPPAHLLEGILSNAVRSMNTPMHLGLYRILNIPDAVRSNWSCNLANLVLKKGQLMSTDNPRVTA
jgi:hypothetical protein